MSIVTVGMVVAIRVDEYSDLLPDGIQTRENTTQILQSPAGVIEWDMDCDCNVLCQPYGNAVFVRIGMTDK